MELEEMKQAWAKIDQRLSHQEIINDRLLHQMTRSSYRSKLNKIGTAELGGTFVCYGAAAYLIVSFPNLPQGLMQFFAVLAVGLLFALPIISQCSLRSLKTINLSSQSYLDAIAAFGKGKIKFLRLQKLNVSLGMLLMLIILPLLGSINGVDISQKPYFWTGMFPTGVLFFIAFSYWVLRSYNKILEDTEKLIKENSPE
jgi:hypothetical protein